MKLIAHLLTKFDEPFVEKLRSKLVSNLELTYGEDIPNQSALNILIAGVIEKKHISDSPNIHTLIIPWAGLPVKTREIMLEFPDIAIHNIHHNAAPAAEMAVSLMMSAAKKIILIDRSFRKNDWTMRYDEKKNMLLESKTALILGYGAIGKRIAQICLGLGMKVLPVNSHGSEDGEKVKIYPKDSLRSLLPKANVLFVSIPHTPETKDLIGADQLSLLPDNAILVNIARGKVVNEKALYEELKSGRISAGLDVWYGYPESKEKRTNTAPSKYDFYKLENVVMTPHLGGHSDDTERLRVDALAEMLNTAARGEPMPNKVDPHRGY